MSRVSSLRNSEYNFYLVFASILCRSDEVSEEASVVDSSQSETQELVTDQSEEANETDQSEEAEASDQSESSVVLSDSDSQTSSSINTSDIQLNSADERLVFQK